MSHMFFPLFLSLAVSFAATVGAADFDWKKVDAALGKSGVLRQDGVQRYSFPRSDLKVTVDGVAIRPALALGGWVAFEPMSEGTMVMGDLVLTETEINPVMSRLLEQGIDVTAVHNHLLRASPATFYMHIEGHGDAVKMGEAIRAALTASKTPFEAPVASTPASVDLDTDALEKTMGTKGQANGGVYQFTVLRRDPISNDEMNIPASMGTGHAINFQPTGGGKAAITGDFVVTSNEVNPLIRALRGNAIEVTAIHSHMLNERPRLFFVHFWANDDALKLARGVRAALEKTALAKN